MPTRRLPSDPNLEQLRNHAKTLQRRVRSGDDEAVALAREFHPRLTDSATELAAFTRADAQLVLARLYGFPSWTKLRRHIELIKQYSRSPHRQPIGGPVRSQQDHVGDDPVHLCPQLPGVGGVGELCCLRLAGQLVDLRVAETRLVVGVGGVSVEGVAVQIREEKIGCGWEIGEPGHARRLPASCCGNR